MSKVWTIARWAAVLESTDKASRGPKPNGVEAWLDQLAKELKDLPAAIGTEGSIPDGKMKPTGEFSYSGPHVVLVSAANYRMKCSRCERDRGCFRVERCFFLASDCQCV